MDSLFSASPNCFISLNYYTECAILKHLMWDIRNHPTLCFPCSPRFIWITSETVWLRPWVYPAFYTFTCSNCCDYNLLPRIINHNGDTHTHTYTHTQYMFIVHAASALFSHSVSASIFVLFCFCLSFSIVTVDLSNCSLSHWFTMEQFVCLCLVKIGNISIDWDRLLSLMLSFFIYTAWPTIVFINISIFHLLSTASQDSNEWFFLF